MNNPDYYTIMEGRIKYFEKKYDPTGKFSKKVKLPSDDNILVAKENRISQRVNTVFNSIIGFLF